jgi:large subunit ribosomal protein L28
MAICQVTGKKTSFGKTYSIRGIAKKRKGIGLKITGKSKRYFKPNLVKKRVYLPEENRFVTMDLSTKALRTIDKNGISSEVHKLRRKGQKI